MGHAPDSAAVQDALGRVLAPGKARRVVSLVPSETESVARLAGVERLVGRTEYCEEPRGAIEAVEAVGGTKKIDRARVIALEPDLVLANQEESSRGDVEALIAAGLRVHVSFPCTIEGSVRYLESLSRLLLGDASSPLVDEARAALAALSTCPGESVGRFAAHGRAVRSSAPRQSPPRDLPANSRGAVLSGATPFPLVRVFVPIWKDPWMSFDDRAFASDVLAHAGLVNVFAHRPRRYPLAADLGEGPETAVDPARDTRYPRFRLEEAIARAPDVALLPDEPYRFTDADADELRRAAPWLRVVRCDGKDLFWYGVRAIGAPARLRARVLAG